MEELDAWAKAAARPGCRTQEDLQHIYGLSVFHFECLKAGRMKRTAESPEDEIEYDFPVKTLPMKIPKEGQAPGL